MRDLARIVDSGGGHGNGGTPPAPPAQASATPVK